MSAPNAASEPRCRSVGVPLPLGKPTCYVDPGSTAVEDASGCYHESPEAALGQLLGWCGCSYSESLRADAAALLTHELVVRAGNPDETAWLPNALPDRDPLYVDLLLHTLDAAGLTDHGSSVRGSFLTEFGKQWARALLGES